METFTGIVYTPFFQLALAAVLGMLLGLERSVVAGKTAGMRTYALVAMGACLFMVVSALGTERFIGILNFDPMRVAAGIVTGIGFLGAGLIIFRGTHLEGLTTSAGIWVSAGIGMAVGIGLYAVATFATFLTLFVFTGLWYVEHRLQAFSNGFFGKQSETE